MADLNAKIISLIQSARKGDSWIPPDVNFKLLDKLLLSRPEKFWVELGEGKALRLFHAAAERVPAYADFLKHEKIDHRRIKNIHDFAQVPITDAKNYIMKYSLEKRCWGGKLPSSQFIATSSGTTGDPKFWPRNGEQDFEAMMTHEAMYRGYFDVGKRSTLLLIGFPMGIYISGMATVLPSWLTSLKDAGLTVMSIGNNKYEMLRAVRHLSASYEQTILIGHPFFIKDVIESGAEEGISWAEKNLGLVFCSEGFNEPWRDYLRAKAGIPASAVRMFNTYGSSEMLLMGYESPFTIHVKRMYERDSGFLKRLLNDPVPPQLFQYNPFIRYVETFNKELIFTSASGIPLVRFNLHDRGETLSAVDIQKAAGVPLPKPLYNLPFMTLWGRTDNTIKLHGANIYPEHIQAGLAEKAFFGYLTGKFVVRKTLNRKMDQGWEINTELRPNVRPNKKLQKEIQSRVTEKLQKINLEFADMSGHIKKDIRPNVVLWPYQHVGYFKPGLKPRYILKNG